MFRASRLFSACFLIFLAADAPNLVLAQQATGSIVGTVADPNGALVPGVRITVTEIATSRSQSVTTNGAGEYQVPYLIPGEYSLTAEHSGFEKAIVSQVVLHVSQILRADFHLNIGATTQSVQVNADATQLQTDSTALGETINRQVTEELPLNGRSFAQLAQLVPGVSPAVNSDITLRRNRGSMGTSIAVQANGFASTQNMYTYDGVPAMDLDSYDFSFSPSIDAIQEFHVVTTGYSAEYGGAPGAFVDLVTKSGTNQYRGTLWEFNRNNDFSARNAFNLANQRLNRNQFGANLGGPVPKARQKLFFFFNWESGRQVAGTFSALTTVAPAGFRTGNFSSSNAAIYDPTTGVAFPNNIIPTSRISPASIAFMQYTPQPNISAGPNNFLTPTITVPTQENQFVPRVDYYAGPRDRLFFRYMFNSLTTNTTLPVFGNDQDNNNGRTQNMAANWTHTFTPVWVINGLAAWDRFYETELLGTTGNAAYNIACGVMKLPGVSCDPYNFGPPSISNGYTDYTVRTNGPRTRLNQTWYYDVNSSIQAGKHLIKFGGKIYRINLAFNEALFPRGVYAFNGQQTAGPHSPVAANQFADFLLGLSSSITLNPTSVASRLNDWNTGYYVQDDWRATPHLTVNVGLRWDYFGRLGAEGNPPALDNFALGNGGGYLISQQIFPGAAGYPPQLVFKDGRDWGPRIGAAWNPGGGKTVIRAGYGLYYSPEISNSYTDMTFNPPFTQSIAASGTASSPIPYDSVAALARLKATPGGLGAYGVQPGLRDSEISQWNLTLERQLPSSIVLDAACVGNQGHFLTTTWLSNRPLVLDQPGALQRSLPSFGSVSEYGSIGDSNYNALQVQLRKTTGNGLTFLGAYTWSHALGDVDGNSFGTGDGAEGIQNIFNLRNSYSDLNFDIRQRMSASVLYDLPIFRHSTGLLRTLAGGWRVGTIISLQTGPASGVTYGVDTTNSSISSLPDEIGDPTLSGDQRSAQKWFNTAAFAPPPSFAQCGACGRFGDSPRLAFHNPGLATVDLIVNKSFQVRESLRLDFRAEAFNAFNHVNLGSANNTFTSAAFGTIGTAQPPRIIQFGMKFAF
jgi:outer membrane receptor protein involved in Fe transport